MEREKGFEPSTLALARRCSTTELFPLARLEARSVLTSQDTVKPEILGRFKQETSYGILKRYTFVTLVHMGNQCT
jgi:hypothetical protein